MVEALAEEDAGEHAEEFKDQEDVDGRNEQQLALLLEQQFLRLKVENRVLKNNNEDLLIDEVMKQLPLLAISEERFTSDALSNMGAWEPTEDETLFSVIGPSIPIETWSSLDPELVQDTKPNKPIESARLIARKERS